MNTQLKPGQLVKHPEKGCGICVRGVATEQLFVSFGSDSEHTYNLTGWEPAEVLRDGHVQVRVDDLNTDNLAGRLTAASRLYATMRAESHKEPATSETVTENDARNLTTTVSLPCPECGETITQGVRTKSTGRHVWALDLLPCPRPVGQRAHRCAPVEPVRLMHPEPTQRGAKASIYNEDGTVERLLRALTTADHLHEDDACWIDQDGTWWTWEDADAAGTLVLGWGDDQ